MKLLALSLLLGSATAACPNACSGHGTCGEYDSCTCEKTWIGADCSLRQCMSGRAWVTTSQGDVNFDGDTDDAATFDTDHLFTEIGAGIFGGNVVLDQMNPGGTFEKWPSVSVLITHIAASIDPA